MLVLSRKMSESVRAIVRTSDGDVVVDFKIIAINRTTVSIGCAAPLCVAFRRIGDDGEEQSGPQRPKPKARL